MVSGRVHETVLARPRDVRRVGEEVDVRWVKYRRKCGNRECPRKTFTEWVPALPPPVPDYGAAAGADRA